MVSEAQNIKFTDKAKMKVVKDKANKIETICNEFEKAVDLDSIKEKAKQNESAGLANAADIEKMMGEFREAALVINHENRKKKAGTGEESKDGEKYGSGLKKKGNGVPRSLRMVDMESERYQEEKKKKLQSLPPEEQHEDMDNRSCMRCSIF